MAASDNVSPQMVGGVTAIAAVLGLIIAVVWAFDIPFSMRRFLALAGLLSLLALVAHQSPDYSVGFIIVTLGLLGIIIEFLIPDVVVKQFEAIAVIINDLLGVDVFAAIDPLPFFLIGVVVVAAMIMARIRLSNQRVYADKIVDLTLKEFATYLQRYITIGRLLAMFLFGAVLITFQEGGELFGALGDMLVQAPFVAVSIFQGIVGFDALGGSLPWIGTLPLVGSLGPWDWAFLVGVMIVLAAGAKFDTSGPLARMFR